MCTTGGYQNIHYNSSTFFVTPKTESVFVRTGITGQVELNITYGYASRLKNFTISGGKGPAIIRETINQLAANAVASVTAVTSNQYTEFRIVYSTLAVGKQPPQINVLDSTHNIFVFTLLDASNYPLFYNARKSFGLAGRSVTTYIVLINTAFIFLFSIVVLH